MVNADVISKVEPWKEGLRSTKSVAAVYGGRGFESFQYRSLSIMGKSPYISSTAIIDTFKPIQTEKHFQSYLQWNE